MGGRGEFVTLTRGNSFRFSSEIVRVGIFRLRIASLREANTPLKMTSLQIEVLSCPQTAVRG